MGIREQEYQRFRGLRGFTALGKNAPYRDFDTFTCVLEPFLNHTRSSFERLPETLIRQRKTFLLPDDYLRSQRVFFKLLLCVFLLFFLHRTGSFWACAVLVKLCLFLLTGKWNIILVPLCTAQ